MNHLTLAAFISGLGLGAGLLIINTIWVFAIAFLFQWLWNTSLPPLFHAPLISYLQAVRLLGLAFVAGAVGRGVKFKFQTRL
ncbi:MAG: hypothetical protein IPP19_03850 [Verrucomicrobia bacterium]|nr:hypothetical protein [Verrucomicrobiota bacterium]